MVIVPTRELAQQVATAAKPLKNAAYGGIRTLALYGGGREGKDAQLGERFGAPHL
jgi:superfamily II DNA/RNA helicase